MKNTEWRFIENYLEADLFQQAYDFVENPDNACEIVNGEHGEFVLKTLPAEKANHSEILFGRKYLKRYTCDCGQAGQNLCIHLAALIILFRRLQNDKAVEKEGLLKKDNNLPARVSIQVILNQIHKDDLDRFIQRYARMNKHFGQALKLHFASRVQVSSPAQKYHDLIKSMTRLIPLANGRLSKHSIQSLFWISEELLLQADDLIAMETPIEAFSICFELLNSYQSIYRKLDLYIGEYEKYLVLIHQKLKALLDFDLAPALRTDIEKKLIVLFNEASHPFINSPNNIFELLIGKLPDPEKQALIESMLKKINRREMNPVPLQAWIRTAMRFKAEDMLEQALNINEDISKWLIVIDAFGVNQKEYARQVSKWLILRTRDEFWRYKLMDKMWSLFPDDSDSVVYALSLLTYRPEEKYIHYLNNKNVASDLIEHSLKDSRDSKAITLLINYYIDLGDMRKAKILVEGNLSIEFLKPFTAKFYPNEEDWLETSYKVAFSKYLENHVGPVPATRIQSTLSYLQLIRCKSLADKLHKWLKKDFADHPTLLETLS